MRNSKTCKARLQLALDKAPTTIQRYLDDNDILLTTKAAIEVIKKEFGYTEDEIFEPKMETVNN